MVNDLIDVEDVPLRNIKSGVSNIGLMESDNSDSQITETYMDALPIEFSHPVLPSNLDPKNFELKLNTGRTATPLYAALNLNHEFNERQTVVIAGYFENLKSSNSSNAEYPAKLNVIENSNPLKLVTPDGLFEANGPSKKSRNTYNNCNRPSLVSAKLSKLSLAGGHAQDGFDNPIKNHGVEYYGTNKKLYRLRLFTSGGFSPDGVSGFLSDKFSEYFEIRAKKPNERMGKISSSDRYYRVKGGRKKFLELQT